MENTQQKIALVTGCSSGFGLLTAIELAKAGFYVVASMRDLNKRDQLEHAAANAGVKVKILRLDVADKDSIDQVIRSLIGEKGRIDVLVNNAGICIAGFVEESTLEDFRVIFETNFFGPVAIIKAVLPIMRKQKSGRIINVTSISSEVPSPATAAYCASKAALKAFSVSLHRETADEGYHISLVSPGSYNTPIFSTNFNVTPNTYLPSAPHYKKALHIKSKVNEVVKGIKQDPIEVALAVVRAATDNCPKLIYTVGTDAKVQSFLKWLLPTRLFDRLINKFWFDGYTAERDVDKS